MVLRICEQLRLNGCAKNALRLKFAKQHGFAGVPSKPPLVVPRTIRGGGICEANDGEVFEVVASKPLSRLRRQLPFHKGEPFGSAGLALLYEKVAISVTLCYNFVIL